MMSAVEAKERWGGMTGSASGYVGPPLFVGTVPIVEGNMFLAGSADAKLTQLIDRFRLIRSAECYENCGFQRSGDFVEHTQTCLANRRCIGRINRRTEGGPMMPALFASFLCLSCAHVSTRDRVQAESAAMDKTLGNLTRTFHHLREAGLVNNDVAQAFLTSETMYQVASIHAIAAILGEDGPETKAAANAALQDMRDALCHMRVLLAMSGAYRRAA